jgi:hypothetical protein
VRDIVINVCWSTYEVPLFLSDFNGTRIFSSDFFKKKYTHISIFIVAPFILITLKFLSPKNAPLYYTYKMLKYTVKISHDWSYMFRSIWTIIREPMPNLAKVTILCRYSVKLRR